MNNKINVFWDMDGVLFKYNKDDYVGDNPAYTKPKYFENRPVDARAYIMFNLMHYNRNLAGLYVLSRGAYQLTGRIRKSVIDDKKTNLRNRIGWFNIKNAIISNESKVDAFVNKFGRMPSKTDFLIDDFNENLISWVNAGGSAIKYINDTNTQNSYMGPKLIDFKIEDIPFGEESLYDKLELFIEN